MQEECKPIDPILIVDDEAEALMGASFMLESAGLTNTITCQESIRVIDKIEEHGAGVVLLDLSMPLMSGEDLLPRIAERFPDVSVIIITGKNKLETALYCMKNGAFDYFVKPVEEARFIASVKKAIELRELRWEYSSFKKRVLSNSLENPEAFSSIVSRNSTMHSLFQYCETIAKTTRPVLITGETGTGKELFARAIHDSSERAGPFVAINIAGLDDTMFSDTLFGHVKGAYTGAATSRAGMIEQAAGGTLFLDEIGDLKIESQVKLLRLLEEYEYFPLGADAARPLEARVVVATNQDLAALKQGKSFRSDLFYRLQTHQVHIPPLRDRLDDLSLLVDYFLEKGAQSLNKQKPTVPPELFTLLATYSFPGNVRELEAMVFEAMSHHTTKMLSTKRFKEHMNIHHEEVQSEEVELDSSASFSLFQRLPTLDEAPKLLIAEAMSRSQGNQTVASQLLGITRSGLSKAIKRYGMTFE